MERKAPFEEGEIYHIYTRGVEKRVVFTSKDDYERCMALLFLCNKDKAMRFRFGKGGKGSPRQPVYSQDTRDGEGIVDILGYTLMPNHLHVVVREKTAGGISKFMLKFMTAYSMYFNVKYQRSGPLFTRPFRSSHVDSDEYFRWLMSYVHLNPLSLLQHDWKERGITDIKATASFLSGYRYSSFADYAQQPRAESTILNKSALPIAEEELRSADELIKLFFSSRGDPQATSLLPTSRAALV